MSVTFKLTGTRRVALRIERIQDVTPKALEAALRLKAEAVMAHSKRKLVPVDLGILRSSGHVGAVERRGRELEVTLAYGGAASAYALPVHEHPSSSSPPSWSGEVTFRPAGRGPKYLERPLMEAVDTMAEEIADLVDAAIAAAARSAS